MFTQISLALNNFIDDVLDLASDQKNLLISKHKLNLSDSLDKGHWTTNLCLIASNIAKKNPKDLAATLAVSIEAIDGVQKVEVAGPGFVNIFLTQQAFLQQIDQGIKVIPALGKLTNQKIQIEFVSANPTGPLHVGHGRGAAYGRLEEYWSILGMRLRENIMLMMLVGKWIFWRPVFGYAIWKFVVKRSPSQAMDIKVNMSFPLQKA